MTTDTRRRCACGTYLSTYNPTDTCFPCQGRLRDHSKEPWKLPFNGSKPVKQYKSAWARRMSGDIDADHERVMAAIREHTHGQFKMFDLYPFLPGVGRGTMIQLMIRAQDQGLVRQVGEERGPTGGIVRVWELVGRVREEVA